MKLPVGHQTVMPYLIIDGASQFIDFTKNVFNAVVNLDMQTMRDDGKIMHSEIQIGGCAIMFSDISEQWKAQTANLFIYVESADETYKKAISAGSKSVMDLSNQDYGRTCGVKDPFGNTWWITSLLS